MHKRYNYSDFITVSRSDDDFVTAILTTIATCNVSQAHMYIIVVINFNVTSHKTCMNNIIDHQYEHGTGNYNEMHIGNTNEYIYYENQS